MVLVRAYDFKAGCAYQSAFVLELTNRVLKERD